MASKPVAPTLDSGFVDVPLVSTAVPTATATSYPLGIRCFNNTDNEITITVTDTAGNIVLGTKPVPAKEPFKEDLSFLPCVGLKWSASAAGLISKIWGYSSWPF